MLEILVALHLIVVHSPGGEEIHVNIDEISSIREPHDKQSGDWLTDNTNCAIGMTNGKFISTRDLCKDIIRQIFEMSPHDK